MIKCSSAANVGLLGKSADLVAFPSLTQAYVNRIFLLFYPSFADIAMENVNETIGSDTKMNVLALVFIDRLRRVTSLVQP